MSEVRVGEWSGVENRRHRRVPLQVPIECRGGSRTMVAKAENISVRGLLVRCTEPFDDDSEISVSFTLPGSQDMISTIARVAHVVPGTFMGLELSALTAEARLQIEQFVASVAPAANSK